MLLFCFVGQETRSLENWGREQRSCGTIGMNQIQTHFISFKGWSATKPTGLIRPPPCTTLYSCVNDLEWAVASPKHHVNQLHLDWSRTDIHNKSLSGIFIATVDWAASSIIGWHRLITKALVFCQRPPVALNILLICGCLSWILHWRTTFVRFHHLYLKLMKIVSGQQPKSFFLFVWLTLQRENSQ